jgi:hypothetical protein
VWLDTPRVYVLDNGSIVRIKGNNVEFLFLHGYWSGLVHGPSLGVSLAASIAILVGIVRRSLSQRRGSS